MNDLLRRPSRIWLILPAAAALTACGGDRAANHLGYVNGAAPEGGDLTVTEGLLLYGLVPLGILGIVALLVWLPGMIRGRYRPGHWSAAPVWFAGPRDPVAAVESAEPGDLQRGGASGSW